MDDQSTEPNPVRSRASLLFDCSLGVLWRLVRDRIVVPVLRVHDSPHALALGLAMGIFVALTPTVGIQMVMVVVIGTLIGANRIVALAMTWISNPVTVVPLYYGYYVLGLAVLGRRGLRYEELKALLSAADGRSSWQTLVEVADRLGSPLWIGSLITATLFTLPAYPLFRRLFERREQQRRENAEAAKASSRHTGAEDPA